MAPTHRWYNEKPGNCVALSFAKATKISGGNHIGIRHFASWRVCAFCPLMVARVLPTLLVLPIMAAEGNESERQTITKNTRIEHSMPRVFLRILSKMPVSERRIGNAGIFVNKNTLHQTVCDEACFLCYASVNFWYLLSGRPCPIRLRPRLGHTKPMITQNLYTHITI